MKCSQLLEGILLIRSLHHTFRAKCGMGAFQNRFQKLLGRGMSGCCRLCLLRVVPLFSKSASEGAGGGLVKFDVAGIIQHHGIDKFVRLVFVPDRLWCVQDELQGFVHPENAQRGIIL